MNLQNAAVKSEVIDIGKLLREADFAGSNVGLNADWDVRAYHIGPGDAPNEYSEDFYILEEESYSVDKDDGFLTLNPPTYALVKRFYAPDDYTVSKYKTGLSAVEAVEAAKVVRQSFEEE